MTRARERAFSVPDSFSFSLPREKSLWDGIELMSTSLCARE